MKKQILPMLISLILICFATDSYCATDIIQANELKTGDIIFWKDNKDDYRAGHVAVVIFADPNPDKLRIVHATDHPKYNAFVETHMLPSEKLLNNNKYYWVIRVKNEKLRKSFIDVINELLQKKIPFNSTTESLMNKWDDSMPSYSTAFKFKLQNQLFAEMSTDYANIPDAGYMCSEVIIISLQKTWQNNLIKLPSSLQLNPILCPPSVFMFAIEKDNNNFNIIGRLQVPTNLLYGKE